MTHGQERFVAGSSMSPALHFFDYRSPMKVYHCTNELPCSADGPPPGHRSNSRQDERYAPMSPPPEGSAAIACRLSEDITCRGHAGSRRATTQATVHAHSAVFENVVSLARSCDVADTFYCGMRGGLLETRLVQGRWAGDGDGNDEAAAAAAAAELPRYWPHNLGKYNAWSQKQRPCSMVVMEETTTMGPDQVREDYFYVPQSPLSPWRGAHTGAPTVLMDASGRPIADDAVTAAACWPDFEKQLETAAVTKRDASRRLPLTPAASDCGDVAEKEEVCAGEETDVEMVRSSFDEFVEVIE